MATESSEQCPQQPATSQGGFNGHVLVVEDEAFNRMLLRKHVGGMGCTITECETGGHAIETARDCRPDVALVDVQLPDTDGFSVCRALTENPLTAGVPVIMVTSRSDIADVERGFEAGAMDYIRKPYNPRELVARVRNAIELKRRGDALRQWKERTSRELALAGTLQRTLLAPRPYLHEKLRIHTAYQPSTEVGGDFFDIVPLSDGRLAIYIGDVAGHGVGPALIATMLKTSLAGLLHDHAAAGPARICNDLHARFLSQIDMPTMFATLFLGIVNLDTRRWQCLSCGHPAPIVAGIEGLDRSDVDKRGGPPIGLSIAPSAPFSRDDEIEFTAPEGAKLLFVTDGLIEAMQDGDADAGGRKLLADLLEEWTGNNMETATDYVFVRMRQQGFDLAHDDCTALAIEHVASNRIILHEEIMPSLHALSPIAGMIEAALQKAGWPDKVSSAVALLLQEHGSNVIQHGRPPPGSRIGIQLRLLGQICELLVRAEGSAWNASSPDPVPTADAERGRGVFIIRRIATRIEACPDGRSNVTVFTVRRDWEPEQ